MRITWSLLAVFIIAGFLCTAPYNAAAQTRSHLKNQEQALQNATLHDGIKAFYAGDYQMAMRTFLKLAHRGDAQAQYYLAYMYDTGQGITRDPNEAARWYLRAAEQAYLPAEVYAGYIYAVGHGMHKDIEKAKKWYEKAAAKGDMIAQNNLGSLLKEDKDDRESLYKAAQWFLASATQGNPSAQFNLATMYREGKGIRRDLEESAKWYLLSALQGNEYAQNALAFMYLHGYGVEKSLARAIQWYRRAAEQGMTDAQFRLAQIYEDQAKLPGIPAENKKSYEMTSAIWYVHAAEKGHVGAAFRLSDHYRSGFGVPKDISKAVRWLEILVERGYKPARLKLAKYLETGEGGIQAQPEKALQWYLDAANSGDGMAMFEAGRLYYDGIGTAKNLAEAYKWFALAVEHIPPENSRREDAVIARVDVSNAMSASDLERARNMVSQWQARRAGRTN